MVLKNPPIIYTHPVLFPSTEGQYHNSTLGCLMHEVCRSQIIRHTTSLTPPNDWSARRRRFYLPNTQQTQGRQCTYNITLRSVCLTIVTVQNQQVLQSLSVCLQPYLSSN